MINAAESEEARKHLANDSNFRGMIGPETTAEDLLYSSAGDYWIVQEAMMMMNSLLVAGDWVVNIDGDALGYIEFSKEVLAAIEHEAQQ